MGCQRVRHNLATEQRQQNKLADNVEKLMTIIIFIEFEKTLLSYKNKIKWKIHESILLRSELKIQQN